MARVNLNGGCYVLGPVGVQPGRLVPVVGHDFGAKHLGQYILDLERGRSPVYAFRESAVILFAAAGGARVTVSGRTFEVTRESGLAIRPGEAFQVTPRGRFHALVTVCPDRHGVTELAAMPDNFDETFPNRCAGVDPGRREAMGERFFQVLAAKPQGALNVTQFIGEIPLSRAPSHHHLYEEALYVLAGEGFMWTGDKKARVEPGSIVFLPKKQEHSLECTSASGLRVVGHFYPAGSPAENY